VRVQAVRPYYEHAGIAIYHANALEFFGWQYADVLVTDPPYGIGWSRGENKARASKAHPGIVGDEDTSARDEVLALWGSRPAVVFGSLAAPPPAGLVQTLIWQKPDDAGVVGSVTGFRRDAEAIYLCGDFPRRSVQWSSVMRGTRPERDWGHPHVKPVDLMARLIALTTGMVADPFMGSGTTLRAAKDLGRKAIGIEIEERYCAIAARRLSQEVLFSETPA
jgi:hypothetical protein